MTFSVVFKPVAEAEIAEAFAWYAQPHIAMGEAFLGELDHTTNFRAKNPHIYVKAEGALRCAHFNRFPYSLFYVIDGEFLNVLACFHQYRDPKSRESLV